MATMYVDVEHMYDIPKEKSMWCVTTWNDQGDLSDQSFWRTREDAAFHARRMQKFFDKHGYADHEVHVEEEEIGTLEDSYRYLDKGAEL